jgi:hypothetical protein
MAGCGGASSASALAGCLARHGVALSARTEQLGVMASEGSEKMSLLKGVVNRHLVEVWFPNGSRQTDDAEAFLAADLSDYSGQPAPSTSIGKGEAVQYKNVIVGWSNRPSGRERAVFVACLHATGSQIVLP